MTIVQTADAGSTPRRAMRMPLVIKLCAGFLVLVALVALLAPLLTAWATATAPPSAGCAATGASKFT